MLDASLRPFVDRLVNPVGVWLAGHGVSANAITIFGFCLGTLAAVMISIDHMQAGFLLIALNRLCDGLDGAVARATGPSDFGGYLDVVLDFVFYAMIPLAFAVNDPGNAVAAAFLIFSFVGTGTSFLAYAIMAEKYGVKSVKHGKKSFAYLGGLTEGSETIILFLLMTLTPAYFVYYASVFGALCWVTTAYRIYEARMLIEG